MKRIVIVGATSGIGLEVAKLCIREGWRVGAAGRREEALEALRATAPEQVETEPLDITRDDAPGQLARLIDKLGGMDIYLHCSGIGKRNTGLLPEIELDTPAHQRRRVRAHGYGGFRLFPGQRRRAPGRHQFDRRHEGTRQRPGLLGYQAHAEHLYRRAGAARAHGKNSASALRTSARVSSPPRCWQATGTTRC